MATTTNYGFNKPTIGGSEDTWGADLNGNWDSVDGLLYGTTAIQPNLVAGAWQIGGSAVTSTAAELNLLDGSAANTVVNNKAVVYGSSGQVQVKTVDLGNWTVTESGGVLYFASGGTNRMKIDAAGNLTVTGNITAYGSV